MDRWQYGAFRVKSARGNDISLCFNEVSELLGFMLLGEVGLQRGTRLSHPIFVNNQTGGLFYLRKPEKLELAWRVLVKRAINLQLKRMSGSDLKLSFGLISRSPSGPWL